MSELMKRLFEGLEGDVFRVSFPVVPPFSRAFAEDDPAGGPGAGGGDSNDDDGGRDGDRSADERARLIGESKKYRQRAQEAERRLKAIEGAALSDEQRDEYARLKADAEKCQADELQARGRYEELLARKQKAFEKALADKDAAVGGLTSLVQRIAGIDRIKSALAARGVKFVDDAAQLLADRVRVEIAEGKPAVRVVDESGEPLTDGDCERGATISVEKLVEQYLATPQGAVWLPPSGDRGTGKHPGGGASKADAALLAELDRDAQKKADFIADKGQEAYHELVARYGGNRKKQEQ